MHSSLLVNYLLLFFCLGSLQVNKTFADLYCPDYDIDRQYSNLFLKLEEAFLSNKTVLNLLRENFMNAEDLLILNVQLKVVNGTCLSNNCDSDYSSNTFCPSNSTEYSWRLCSLPDDYGFNNTLQMTFSSYAVNIDERRDALVCNAITWLSQLRGNFPNFGLIVFFNPCPLSFFYYPNPYDEEYFYPSVSMTMVMDTLECNPPFCMTKSVSSEILRWVCVLFHYVNQFIVISPYRSKYTQSLEKTHHHMLGTRIRGELLIIVLIMIMIYIGMK